MIKVLHASDLHGYYWNKLWATPGQDFDLVLLTGDMLPNWHRGPAGGKEGDKQKAWLLEKDKPKHATHRLGMAMGAFGDVPVVVVDGNHDFFCLGDFMLEQGYENVYPIKRGIVHELLGHRITGFPNINWIAGEWAHETRAPELAELCEELLAQHPTLIANHAPLSGYLDNGYGIRAMPHLLHYRQSDWVQYYFHGHVHEHGGKTTYAELGGLEDVDTFVVQIFNGATTVKIHEIEEGPFV